MFTCFTLNHAQPLYRQIQTPKQLNGYYTVYREIFVSLYLHTQISWISQILLSCEINLRENVAMLHLLQCMLPTWIIRENIFLRNNWNCHFCEILMMQVFPVYSISLHVSIRWKEKRYQLLITSLFSHNALPTIYVAKIIHVEQKCNKINASL